MKYRECLVDKQHLQLWSSEIAMKTGLFIFLIALLPALSLAGPQGDGKIRLFNYHLNEFAEVTFRRDSKLIESAREPLNHLFRSRDNSENFPIHIPLIDLLDHLQDHFAVDAIEIISGYRRKAFNEQLREEGHAVGKVSFHTKGMAADIHIDEIREETLRDYALSLKAGGVGYYGPFDFVHVDFGPVRQWGKTTPFPRKLIGVLAKNAAIQLTSDKNDYLVGDTLHFQWTGFDAKTIQQLRLEHFFRGQWHVINKAPQQVYRRQFKLNASSALFQKSAQKRRYGKYRWTFRTKDMLKLQSSNEFYLKRL